MSDWTSAWSGFREGMGQMASGRAHRHSQQNDDERLRLMKAQADRDAEASKIDVAIKKLRLERPSIATPEGFRKTGVTFDEFGREVPSFERIPDSFDPNKHVITLGKDRVILNPSTGQPTQVVKGNWWESMMGGQQGGPPQAFHPPMQMQAPGAPEAPQALGDMEMSGIGPDGPTFRKRPKVSEPEIVTRDIGGGAPPQRFIRTTDPMSGEVKLSPYSLPDSANKISDKTVTQQNLDAAMRYADQLDEVITRSGTWENRFGNADDAAALEQVPYLLAISMAKILDPGSVAREGEVNAAKKYMIPLGALASADTAKAAIKRLKQDLTTRAAGLGLQVTTSPDGPVKVSSKEDYDKLPSKTQYVDDSGVVKIKP